MSTFNHNDKFFVTSGGSIGVGVEAPNQDFHIKRDGSAPVIHLERINSNAGYLLLNGSINPSIAFDDGQNFRIATVSNSNFDGFSAKFTVKNDGNIGIGSDNPTYKLQVQGTFYVNETAYINGNTEVNAAFSQTGGAASSFSGTLASKTLTITPAGEMSQRWNYYTSGGNDFSLEHHTGGMYIYNRSTSAALWSWSNIGYFGIGTDVTPSVALDVKGTTNLASRFIFTKDLSTDKVLFGGADHDTFGGPFIGASSNHNFTITQNGAAAITINSSKKATFNDAVHVVGELGVLGSNGNSNNRLKATYNGTSGIAIFGPHSTGGNTSLQIGTSASGTYDTALTIASNKNATFEGDNATSGIIRSAKNIVSNSTYNLISMHSTRSIDDYGGLNKNYMQMNLITPGANTTGGGSAHGYGNFSLKLANNGANTNMNEVLNIEAGGTATFLNNVDATNFRSNANSSYSLTPNTTNKWQLNTPSGYLRLGPGNTSYAHIETDRSTFYFNKNIVVNGGEVQSYDENLVLRRANSNATISLGEDSNATNDGWITMKAGEKKGLVMINGSYYLTKYLHSVRTDATTPTHTTMYQWYTLKNPAGYSSNGLASSFKVKIYTAGRHANGSCYAEYLVRCHNANNQATSGLGNTEVFQLFKSGLDDGYGGKTQDVTWYVRNNLSGWNNGEILFRVKRGNREPVDTIKIEPIGADTSTDWMPTLVSHGGATAADGTRPTSDVQEITLQYAGLQRTGTSDARLIIDTNGGANGTAHETARFINRNSNGYSSYFYIGSTSGTDWRLGKNILGASSGSNFEIATHSGTTKALEINSSTLLSTFAGKIATTSTGTATIAAIQLRPQVDGEGLGISAPVTDQMNFITADNTRMVIKSDGKVGIGTDSPGAGLEVAWGADPMLRLRYNANYYTNYSTNNIDATGTNQTFAIKQNGANSLAFDANKNATFALNVTASRFFSGDGGNKTNPMIANGSDEDTGIFFPAANTMAFTAGDTEAFRIAGANATFAGTVNFNDHTLYGDQVKGRFGAGGDLEIYHDGSNSYIENETGHFYIKNKADNGDMYFQSDDMSGGLVNYFYLDGGIGETIFSRNTLHTDQVHAQFGTSSDLRIYHDGSNSYISDSNSSSDLLIRSNHILLQAPSGENMIFCNEDAEVKLYYNNSAMVQTISDGIAVPATKGVYFDGGAHTYIKETSSDVLKIFVGSNGEHASFSGGNTTFAGKISSTHIKYCNKSISNSYERIYFAAANNSQIATAVRLTGTSHGSGHVGNFTANILVNHYQDVNITSQSGGYTQVTLKVESNNNGDYTLSVKSSSSNAATYYFKIEAISDNLDITTLPSSTSATNTTHEHTTVFGTNQTGEGGQIQTSFGNDVAIGSNIAPERALHVYSNSDNPLLVDSSDDTTGIIFRDPTASNSIFYRGNGDYFYTTAKFGIGTTSPGSKLEVVTTGTNSVVELDNSTANYTILQFNAQGATKGFSGFNTSFMLFGGESGTDTRLQAGGQYAMTIRNSDRNVGIGHTDPQNKLHVVEDTSTWEAVEIESSSTTGCGITLVGANVSNLQWSIIANASSGGAGKNNLGWHLTGAGDSGGSTGYKMSLTPAGLLTVTGDVVAFGSPSDASLKENVKPIDNALDKVSKLKGVTFDWKQSNSILDIKEDIGFIAQDVRGVLPELVRTNKDGKLSLRDKGIVPVLVEAIKELKAEIEELKCKCDGCTK